MRRVIFEWRYLTRHAPWDTGISPPELTAFLEEREPGSAIDLGCGTGTNTLTMARYGWRAVGVDISLLAILMARQKTRRAGLAAVFKRADVSRLPGIEGPFDFALDIGCFHALAPVAQSHYVACLLTRLHPGADYLLYTKVRARPGDPSGAPTEYAIRALFSAHMQLVQVTQGEDRGRTSAWYHWRVEDR